MRVYAAVFVLIVGCRDGRSQDVAKPKQGPPKAEDKVQALKDSIEKLKPKTLTVRYRGLTADSYSRMFLDTDLKTSVDGVAGLTRCGKDGHYYILKECFNEDSGVRYGAACYVAYPDIYEANKELVKGLLEHLKNDPSKGVREKAVEHINYLKTKN